MTGRAVFLSACLLLAGTACSKSTPAPEAQPPAEGGNDTIQIRRYTYEVIHVYPHDRGAFTQGLIFADGVLYESTGQYGRSSLRKADPETGQALQSEPLADQLLGEGPTLFGERLIQLTWLSQVGFVYDRESFARRDQFAYLTEGWGLTHDGKRLIMSDGTSVLYFLDPGNFAETGQLQVRDDRGPVTRLNELEWIDGEIFANIWQTDYIARISPQSGRVTGWVFLGDLLSAEDRPRLADAVLNGIAYDPATKRLFVTGKLWPKLFEIKLIEQKD